MVYAKLVRRRLRRHSSAAASAASLLRILFLLAWGLFFAVPILWLVLATTKTRAQLFSLNPLAFGSLANVSSAWNNLMSFNDGEILHWLSNSVVYSVIALVGSLLICVPAGYALAKFQFAGRQVILVLTLITMIIPFAAMVLPLYMEMNALQLLGNPLSVILPWTLFPFGVFLAYLSFVANMPDSLVEAARLDGASEFGIFVRIGIPLSGSAVSLIAFFGFLRSWTDFFLPFVMLSDDRTYTIQVGLASLIGSGAILPSNVSFLPIHEPEAALAGVIAVLPILVAFLVAQRFLLASQLVGFEKG